jgi:hypothetical protein
VPVRYLSKLLGQQRRISFSEMLDETHVMNRFSGNSVAVQPHQMSWFTFTVAESTGAMLVGTLEINGGSRHVGVFLANINDVPIANFGRMIGEGRINQRLPPGQYVFVYRVRSPRR